MKKKKKSMMEKPLTSAESKPEQMVVEETTLDENNEALKLLKLKESAKWLHLDQVEPEELVWLPDLPRTVGKLKLGEEYEARFDMKGVLLPGTADLDKDKDDRGDEPEHPGYTLQELFRLARSNILQQRIYAFDAIGGILHIYQQGYYDPIFKLPVSKTFFLIRLAFDENGLYLLEVVAYALSQLFYNESDEMQLDLIHDNQGGDWQPRSSSTEKNPAADDDNLDPLQHLNSLQHQLSKLQIKNEPYTAQVDAGNDDDDMPEDEMTDFHLAEKHLMVCLLRTNILERITYILITLRPKNSTENSCLKILIRLARTNETMAMNIINQKELLQYMHTNFLPPSHNNSEEHIQMLCLKLLRVLAAHSFLMSKEVQKIIPLIEIAHHYLIENEGNIKLQIEALRLLRTLYTLTLSPEGIA